MAAADFLANRRVVFGAGAARRFPEVYFCWRPRFNAIGSQNGLTDWRWCIAMLIVVINCTSVYKNLGHNEDYARQCLYKAVGVVWMALLCHVDAAGLAAFKHVSGGNVPWADPVYLL